MIFNERDLEAHGDLEKSYLKIVPDKIESFVNFMGQRASVMMLGDGSIAKATGDGQAGGTIVVDKPELFRVGEKVEVDDDNSNAVSGYITAINLNTKTLTIQDARSAGANVNLSAFTTSQNAKVGIPAWTSAGFTGLKAQLLSAANGGSSTIAGKTKTSYPHLQAINVDGSGFAAATCLEDLFSAYFDIARYGHGNPNEIIVPFAMLKHIVKNVELKKDYKVMDTKVGYGFRSFTILGTDGELTITGLREAPSDCALVLDWKALKFFGMKPYFNRKRHFNGEEAFLVRNTTGYQYLVDMSLQGDLVATKPSHCGIIYSLASAVTA